MGSFEETLDFSHTDPISPNGHSDVHCDPSPGINVLIVGAGVGGLVAAIECYRKGHNVRIWERSKSAAAGGDMFTIGLCGRLFVQHCSTMMQECDQILIHDAWLQYRKHTSEAISEAKPFASLWADAGIDPNNASMVMQMRPLWHKMLWQQVKRFGIEVSFGKRVTEYLEDPDRGVAGVVTEHGERAEADVVLAADGVDSRSQYIVMPGGNKGKRSGRSVYRPTYPPDLAMADPLVKEFFGPRDGKYPDVQARLRPDTYLVALCYFDKDGNNGQMVWGITFFEKGEQTTKESWHQTVSSEDVIKTLRETPGWGDAVEAMVKATPSNHIVEWPLIFRNPQPRWHSPAARIIQVGNAAHTFLPTSGNGATQAIEDAITIAECLKQADRKNVPTAVKAHKLLRFDHVSCAQRLGWENDERFHKAGFANGPIDLTKVQARVPKWIFTHDPEQYAVDNYAQAAACIKDGTEFQNTNIPPGHAPTLWTMEEVLASKLRERDLSCRKTGPDVDCLDEAYRARLHILPKNFMFR